MRYCSDDALLTGERNVNPNKNDASENVASNLFHPDEPPPSFILKHVVFLWLLITLVNAKAN